MKKITGFFFLLFAVFTGIRAESQSTDLPEDLLIPYRKGDKWGFCNPKKEIIIPVKYDVAAVFSEKRAFVRLDGKWGSIDATGGELGLS